MAQTLVPINGQVLHWAMSEAGYSDQVLAQRLKTDPGVVGGWRQGLGQPSTTQFRQLARALRRPASFFFMAQPPVQTGVPASFRRAPGQQADELTPKELDAVRAARRVQKLTRWLIEAQPAETIRPKLPRATPTTSAAKAALAVRELLSWDTNRQVQARSLTALTADLRSELEDAGVIVMQLSLGKESCRGFSLLDDTTPLIAANSAYLTQARAYSYLHELGHLVRGTESICFGNVDRGLERWCEEFAAEFLIPRAELLAYVDQQYGKGAVVADPRQVSHIANHFKVSRLATATGLDRAHRATALLWDEIKQQSELVKKRGGGQNTEPQTSPVIRLREWGRAPARLLLDAANTGLLTQQDVQEYLRLSRHEVEEVRGRLHTSATATDEV